MRGSLFSWLAGACLWFTPPTAALASASEVHFEWQRPVGSTCPPQASIERDVEQALGRQVFTSARSARLLIRGVVEDRASGVLVHLDARALDGRVLGSRELRAQAGECAALRNSIDLVLTLLIENDGGFATGPGAAVALRFRGGLWAGLALETLPRATFGAGPALAMDLGAYAQLRMDAAYWLPVAIQTARGIRADLHLVSLALRVCARIAGGEQSPSVLSVRMCGGAQLGALIAVQTRPDGPTPQVRLLAQAVGIELRSALRLGRTSSLELGLAPLVALNRTSIFAVGRDGSRAPLYRSPLLGLLLSLAFLL